MRPAKVTELEDLRRLRYFVAVAEAASFTRAARTLHVSQPAVSEAVRQLERSLDVTLFARSHRPIALTDAGRALLNDGRGLLAAAQVATARVRRVAAGVEDEITIASTQTLSEGFIPKLVGRLQRRVPQRRTHHRPGWTSDVTGLVESGRATVGFVRHAPRVMGLYQATLDHEPVVACLALDHRLAAASKLSLWELASERWAVMDPVMAPRSFEAFASSCVAAGFEPEIAELVAAADFSAAETTYKRVATGEVVTYVGASLVPMVTRFGIRCVALDPSLPALPVDALWRPDDPLAESVVGLAREVCAGNWWSETTADILGVSPASGSMEAMEVSAIGI